VGWVLLRLKSGRWVGGEFGASSFAAGYPEPVDIFIAKEFEVDQDAEDFVRNPDGDPVERGWGLLVRWDEVEYLVVSPVADVDG
jgi:hypothetical protein